MFVSLDLHLGRKKNVRLPASLRQLWLDREDLPTFDLGLSRHIEAVDVYCYEDAEWPPPDLAELSAFVELKKLRIVGASDLDIKSLAGMASLRELDLRRSKQLECRYGDEAFACLSGLRELQSLKSDWRFFADDGLAVLRNFKQLRRLNIMIGRNATEAGIDSIRDLRRLQSLRLVIPPELSV